MIIEPPCTCTQQPASPEVEQPKTPEEPFLDGMPLEDLDGAPLDAAVLDGKPILPVEDLDGEDLAEDLDGLPCKSL